VELALGEFIWDFLEDGLVVRITAAQRMKANAVGIQIDVSADQGLPDHGNHAVGVG
jgi:hypothetical protein